MFTNDRNADGAYYLRQASDDEASVMMGTHSSEAGAAGKTALIMGGVSYGFAAAGGAVSLVRGANRAVFTEEQFNTLRYDKDKGKFTAGAVEEVRAVQAAQTEKLVRPGPILRGERGADMSAGGVELSIKAFRDDAWVGNPRSVSKLVGSLNADGNLRLLLDTRALTAQQVSRITDTLTQSGIDPARILAPAPKSYGPITVVGPNGKSRH